MPNSHRSLSDEIADLSRQREELKSALPEFPSGERQWRLHNLARLEALLGEKELELQQAASSASVFSTRPRVFGVEVTQGLPGYQLVAGKDTLVRVFVGTPEPEVLAIATATPHASSAVPHHFDTIWPFSVSRLDYAELVVTGPVRHRFPLVFPRPRGRFVKPGKMETGEFTNLRPLYSEADNVNFYISGSQLSSPGTYEFRARFFRDGMLVRQVDIGRRTFHPTKDLRLLIVVDTWPMPVAAWNTLLKALTYVSRNFPIRSGVGPLDGDPNVGLRYRIEPTPFDPDWPDWGPVNARLNAFNASQSAQLRPDRAEHALTVRTQQPFEGPLGGTANAGPGGRIAGVVLNVSPPSDDRFGVLISHEIGHNFLGAAHSPEPFIGANEAFDLLEQRAIPSPRSVMYGTIVGTNHDALFLPDDWKGIREGLLTKSSTGPA